MSGEWTSHLERMMDNSEGPAMSDHRELARSLEVVTAICCREWPVTPFFGIGRCGLCGQVPVVKDAQDE